MVILNRSTLYFIIQDLIKEAELKGKSEKHFNRIYFSHICSIISCFTFLNCVKDINILVECTGDKVLVKIENVGC